jgi:hypothetical protein
MIKSLTNRLIYYYYKQKKLLKKKEEFLKQKAEFLKQKEEFLKQGGEITKDYIILNDYNKQAGVVSGNYFHQDLLVANMIFNEKPVRHVDVGSRIDGFVAHVAAFRKIEIVDIRPLASTNHQNITFIQADLMNPASIKKTDSISCLHAIEHFGLGRYSDPIDINGHIKGINNLVYLVEKHGHLYISFPIGTKNEVHFNAHRIFHPNYILSIPSIREHMKLKRFDYVNDDGDLILNTHPDNVKMPIKNEECCGIYTFQKI